MNVRLNPDARADSSIAFETGMRTKIVGQDDALAALADIYRMNQAGLCAPGRPMGTLLFLGPTGTGKTRAVEAMAQTLFGSDRCCLKIDCAEFQHSHEIAKLVGSPPGYLGHRETHPLLTQETLNQYHTEKDKVTLLLFDEIEKASDALWQLLLGVMDKATLTLGDNRQVDFSRCIIILTSNLGSTEIQNMLGSGLGFNSPTASVKEEKIEEVAIGAARRKFTPEFMNRIDKVVVFHRLTDAHLRLILEIELAAIQKRFLESPCPVFLYVSQKMKDLLLVEGTDPKYGARHLRRALDRLLVMPISNLIITQQVEKYKHVIRVDVTDAGTTFDRVDLSAEHLAWFRSGRAAGSTLG